MLFYTAVICRLLARGFVELAQLAFTVSYLPEKAPGEFDGLFFGVRFKNGEATDNFFCFDKRAVGNAEFVAGAANSRA